MAEAVLYPPFVQMTPPPSSYFLGAAYLGCFLLILWRGFSQREAFSDIQFGSEGYLWGNFETCLKPEPR